MNHEQNRICQNCKKDFVIEQEDFNFYEKIKVPPPTFCPECRFTRRLNWRNERTLYKRVCDLCKNITISMYPANAIFPVYCKKCWYSDKWDSTKYGISFDFSKSFFQQWKELSKIVPKIALFQRNAINSDYSNMVGECKNVYLSVSVVLGCENIFYSRAIDKCNNIFDCYNIKESNNCFEDIEGEKNYNTQNTIYSRNCLDSYFLFDCVNCSHCFMCSNLRNSEFFILNKKYSKEDYFSEIKKINFGSKKLREILINEFNLLKNKAICRYANIIKAVDSTGNDLLNVKNCKNCFEMHDSENMKYGFRVFLEKDCMDVAFSGKGELIYEYCTGSLNDYNIKFSYSAFDTVQNAEYIESCILSNNIFSCISIKNKNYVILNKQYTKEQYEELVPKIIKHMNDMPYIDKKGRIYKYGEFFPTELSPFCYNETIAQEYFPLTKEQAIDQGYKWKDREERNYIIDIKNEDIPDDIKDIDESIINKVIECSHKGECNQQCTEAFKIIEPEFQFYKRMNLPLPKLCPNCRHYERLAQRNPLKLWHRQCMCDKENHNHEGRCEVEFETSYSPDRPEIVYCERCYQQEIY